MIIRKNWTFGFGRECRSLMWLCLMTLLFEVHIGLLIDLRAEGKGRPVRILFLGHDSTHHNSNEYFPVLARELGRDGIYFDYQTKVSEALKADYLKQFDGVLLYANHMAITPRELENLVDFVESGGGFIPVHCASACFTNQKRFIELVGGRFKSHGGEVFTAKITNPNHPAVNGVKEFTTWDETYVHDQHNSDNRTILMTRTDDQSGHEEPWTWVRSQGEGRVFYTASGHDERTWNDSGFHQLLKSGILWAIGDNTHLEYQEFLKSRRPLKYEKRDNVPNYERRPEPLALQHPLSAEDSLDYTRAPIGFEIQTFATEPMIVNPMAMSWDSSGRLWVIESIDYPNEIPSDRTKGRDSIKILEDTNNDGKADKVTVFADGLNIPTSLLCIDGGVIVFQAPDAIFMRDTDGDDRVDEKKILFSGFGMGDTHAGPSNLRLGLDNWIYGTVGYSRFRGEVGGEQHDFGMGVFRFKKNGSKMEFLHQFNNNTWGLGFNSDGEVFGSTANNNPSFFGGLSAVSLGTPSGSAKMIASSPKFHPITPNIRQVDAFGAYTAGCGHSFTTTDKLPDFLQEDIALVNGPTGNLTGMYRIVKDGAGYLAKNNFAFVASADEWFSPIQAEVGPDGHIWIADWYNFIIQHNPTPSSQRGGYDAKNGKGNAHINPNRDRQHGRIYKVVWKGAKQDEMPTLKNAGVRKLVRFLGHSNQFWRLKAQEILTSKRKLNAAQIKKLKNMVMQNKPSAVHAFSTLNKLGQIDVELHQSALLAGSSAVKVFAIKALEVKSDRIGLLYDTPVLTDADPRVRLAAFEKLSSVKPTEVTKNIVIQLLKEKSNRQDEWLDGILKVCARVHNASVKRKLSSNLLSNGSFEEIDEKSPVGWSPRTYSGEATHDVDSSVARSGKNSIRIASKSGSDTSWHQAIPVKPNTDYRLSAWVKTENVSGAMGALVNVHISPNRELTSPVKGSENWTEVSMMLNSGGRNSLDINALFGGWGRSKGTAWFDDFSLQEAIIVEGSEEENILANADNGKKIFSEHAIAACNRCHKVAGVGGEVGPALDGIASRKAEDYIMESLVNPNAVIAEGYKLQASPMPPMGLILKPQELADIMAYLMTLK